MLGVFTTARYFSRHPAGLGTLAKSRVRPSCEETRPTIARETGSHPPRERMDAVPLVEAKPMNE